MIIGAARGAALLVLFTLATVVRAGDEPTISGAWARATAPGLEVGAAYMVIEGGSAADRVVHASSPRAAMVQLHSVEEREGVAAMREVEAIEVPAGQRIELAPMGLHLMLMGLDGPLVAGQSFPITLRFATAGERTVTVLVKPATADAAHQPHH
jgi:periplasmic copper chaperone A